jgi:hypothetical protein
MLPAQIPPASCAKSKHSLPACCRHGCTMPCCKAKNATNSQPLPILPAGNQNQFSLVCADAAVGWNLPQTPQFSSSSSTTFIAKSEPLYAVNCARLI